MFPSYAVDCICVCLYLLGFLLVVFIIWLLANELWSFDQEIVIEILKALIETSVTEV